MLSAIVGTRVEMFVPSPNFLGAEKGNISIEKVELMWHAKQIRGHGCLDQATAFEGKCSNKSQYRWTFVYNYRII